MQERDVLRSSTCAPKRSVWLVLSVVSICGLVLSIWWQSTPPIVEPAKRVDISGPWIETNFRQNGNPLQKATPSGKFVDDLHQTVTKVWNAATESAPPHGLLSSLVISLEFGDEEFYFVDSYVRLRSAWRKMADNRAVFKEVVDNILRDSSISASSAAIYSPYFPKELRDRILIYPKSPVTGNANN
jgi:hypothetical protein